MFVERQRQYSTIFPVEFKVRFITFVYVYVLDDILLHFFYRNYN